jgi:hypothetical protein
VGGDAFGCARKATLLITRGALQAIPQDVEPGSVLMRGDRIGHLKLSMRDRRLYALRAGSSVRRHAQAVPQLD